MAGSFLLELARRNRHNLRTLRQTPAAEISGALGDLGTLLPLMIALALQGSIDLSSTLVFSGLFNIVTGAVFGIPLPVQPMKAIAASALSTPLTLRTTTAAGALVSLAVLLLSLTGALRLLTRHIPVPVIKGIQLGAALRLVISGGNLILPLPWLAPHHPLGGDSRLLALCAFVALLLTQRAARFPYALILFLLGLVMSVISSTDPPSYLTTLDTNSYNTTTTSAVPVPVPAEAITSSSQPPPNLPFTFTLPAFTTPLSYTTALSQLPLTTLNSILAVAPLSADLLPSLPAPSVTSLGFSVSAMNLVGCWFGAMPVCHGAGGLAAQVRFGARSGASVIFLGVVKMVLGLVAVYGGGGGGRDGVVGVLRVFPRGLLGVMVIAAGLELGKVGAGLNRNAKGGAVDLWEESVASRDGEEGGRWREVGMAEQQERWMVMMVTAAGILAFKNDAVGFLAGCCCHGAYRVADWFERRRVGGMLGERRPLLR